MILSPQLKCSSHKLQENRFLQRHVLRLYFLHRLSASTMPGGPCSPSAPVSTLVDLLHQFSSIELLVDLFAIAMSSWWTCCHPAPSPPGGPVEHRCTSCTSSSWWTCCTISAPSAPGGPVAPVSSWWTCCTVVAPVGPVDQLLVHLLHHQLLVDLLHHQLHRFLVDLLAPSACTCCTIVSMAPGAPVAPVGSWWTCCTISSITLLVHLVAPSASAWCTC